MNKISIQYHKTLLGELILGTYEDQLCLCDWRYRKLRSSIDKKLLKEPDASCIEEETSIIKNTIVQLNEYLDGERTEFTIPLLLVGTSFQKTVWKELLKIPFGETVSYSELSRKISTEKAIRAIAAANGANAIAIIVPCHRVVGSRGELVGYAGGIRTKMKLLQLEKAIPEQKLLFD